VALNVIEPDAALKDNDSDAVFDVLGVVRDAAVQRRAIYISMVHFGIVLKSLFLLTVHPAKTKITALRAT
jgi:hypothetical protein